MTEPSPELLSPEEFAEYQAGDPALLLAFAEGMVRGYCGWHIAPSRTETLTVDGEGTSQVFLPTLYLTAVNTVSDDGTAVDLTDVDWWENGRLVRDDDECGVWTCGPRTVAANVDHGYDEVPYDIRAVMASIAARTTVVPDGIQSESTGQVSITYMGSGADGGGASGFTANELRVLDRYRIFNRP